MCHHPFRCELEQPLMKCSIITFMWGTILMDLSAGLVSRGTGRVLDPIISSRMFVYRRALEDRNKSSLWSREQMCLLASTIIKDLGFLSCEAKPWHAQHPSQLSCIASTPCVGGRKMSTDRDRKLMLLVGLRDIKSLVSDPGIS